MKIAVVGAGAIGGWLAVRLAQAGENVSLLARGRTLEAIKARGLTLVSGSQTEQVRFLASDNADELGAQDLIIVGVKGPAMTEVAPSVAAMMHAETAVLPAMNGILWWFTDGVDGTLSGSTLESIDPGGRIAALIPPAHVLGCVVHASCSTRAPGEIVHTQGKRLIIGEPRHGQTQRLERVCQRLSDAGLTIEPSRHIQTDVWFKLWGNMTMNPISALTGALTNQILDDELVRRFALGVMSEASELGARIGCPIRESGEDRMALTRKLGGIKTSMLQDVEAGRRLEIDALLAAPREIAAKVGLATPTMDALHGLVRLYARIHSL